MATKTYGTGTTFKDTAGEDYETGEAWLAGAREADYLRGLGATGQSSSRRVSRISISNLNNATYPTYADTIKTDLPGAPTLPTYTRPERGAVGPFVAPTLTSIDPFIAPELTPADPFTAPKYDERRVSALTQKSAAPYLYQARLGLREAVGVAGRGEYNPNVTARNLKSALQGYGVAVGGIVETAGRVGREQYAQEYGIKAEEAKINYAQAIADRNITFGAKAEEAKMNYAQAIADRDIMFSAKTEEARTNHAQAIADRDAIFNADMHSADVNFQTAIDNIKMVYGAEVAAEIQFAADENKRNLIIFDAAMDDYLRGGGGGTSSAYTTPEAMVAWAQAQSVGMNYPNPAHGIR